MLARVVDLADQGALQPTLDQAFPLERAGEAIDAVLAGQVRGTVVVSC